MVLRQEIFSYMRDGEELVESLFRRLIDDRMLMAYPHDGFWSLHGHVQGKAGPRRCVFSRGNAPWAVWDKTGLPKHLKAHDSAAVFGHGNGSRELM